jgi:hypothetical protein
MSAGGEAKFTEKPLFSRRFHNVSPIGRQGGQSSH